MAEACNRGLQLACLSDIALLKNSTSASRILDIVCMRESHTKVCKLTWLVLGGDPAARSHRVEQLTAL